jgi:hypothetical protein
MVAVAPGTKICRGNLTRVDGPAGPALCVVGLTHPKWFFHSPSGIEAGATGGNVLFLHTYAITHSDFTVSSVSGRSGPRADFVILLGTMVAGVLHAQTAWCKISQLT